MYHFCKSKVGEGGSVVCEVHCLATCVLIIKNIKQSSAGKKSSHIPPKPCPESDRGDVTGDLQMTPHEG